MGKWKGKRVGKWEGKRVGKWERFDLRAQLDIHTLAQLLSTKFGGKVASPRWESGKVRGWESGKVRRFDGGKVLTFARSATFTL